MSQQLQHSCVRDYSLQEVRGGTSAAAASELGRDCGRQAAAFSVAPTADPANMVDAVVEVKVVVPR